MRAIAKASHNRSLHAFQESLKTYKKELIDDPIINAHSKSLYDTMLEQNLCRIIEPYSRVQVCLAHSQHILLIRILLLTRSITFHLWSNCRKKRLRRNFHRWYWTRNSVAFWINSRACWSSSRINPRTRRTPRPSTPFTVLERWSIRSIKKPKGCLKSWNFYPPLSPKMC